MPGCDPSWQIANTLPGADNVNDTIGWDPDGAGPLPEHIVICGYAGIPTTGYRGIAGNTIHWGVALFNPSTNEWSTLGNSPAPGSSFARMGVDSNNLLYICTERTIYRWQQGVWITIGQTVDSFARFADLVPGDNGEMFAVGLFTSINGVTAYGAARFDGAQWHSLAQGLAGAPNGAFRRQNGNLLAYGAASSFGGVSYSGLIEWDGTSWTVFNNTPFLTAQVATELASGELVAGSSMAGLHRFDGTTWSPIGAGVGAPLTRLLTRPNGDLIVAGNFINFAGMPARFLASWDGTTWSTLGNNPDTPKPFRMTNMSNGDLLVSGTFNAAGDAAAVNVARWDGSKWRGCGDGFNREVTVLKRLSSDDILAAGNFSGLASANGGSANRIARFDGQQWHAYGDGLDGLVRDVIELPNGDLVAVGDFLNSGTTPAARVAYWNGTTWSALGTGADANLTAVTSLPNGDLVVGGYTFFIGGVLVRHLARWDGTTWHAFGSGVANTGLFATGVDALVTLANGDLIVGGTFTSIDGVLADGIARWDGNTWHAMPGGSSVLGTGRVHALYLDPNDTLFAAATGQLWQWNTTSWTALGLNGSYGDSIECFATLPNGQLLTGNGSVIYVLPQQQLPDSNLQRWTPGSTGSTEFANYVPGSVKAMLLEEDGSVLIGGNFEGTFPVASAASFSPNGFLARLSPTCPATTVAVGAGCLGAAGPATLSSNSAPWLGSLYTATATGMPANSIAIELYSNSTLMLPLSLPSTPGCLMLANSIAANATITSGGQASTSWLVPSSGAFVGLKLTQQVVALSFQPTGIQAVSTNALELTTGAI